MNYTVVINCAVWFGALAYYFLDARKWFKGPKITIDTDDLTEEAREALKEEGLDVTGLEPVHGVGEEAGMTTGTEVYEKEKDVSVVN
jgi:hypothetical protein